MAKTFLNLQDDLATWLKKDTTSLPIAIRKDLINIAQRDFSTRFNTKYNQMTDSFVTIQNDFDYTVPVGFKHHIDFWYAGTDNAHVSLIYKDKSEFDALFPDTTDTGQPSHFSIWADTLFLGPTPDAVYTINRLYFRIRPDLVADGDDNKLLQEAWELVLWKALALTESFGLDDERIPVWLTSYERDAQKFAREDAASRVFRFNGQANVSR